MFEVLTHRCALKIITIKQNRNKHGNLYTAQFVSIQWILNAAHKNRFDPKSRQRIYIILSIFTCNTDHIKARNPSIRTVTYKYLNLKENYIDIRKDTCFYHKILADNTYSFILLFPNYDTKEYIKKIDLIY